MLWFKVTTSLILSKLDSQSKTVLADLIVVIIQFYESKTLDKIFSTITGIMNKLKGV